MPSLCSASGGSLPGLGVHLPNVAFTCGAWRRCGRPRRGASQRPSRARFCPRRLVRTCVPIAALFLVLDVGGLVGACLRRAEEAIAWRMHFCCRSAGLDALLTHQSCSRYTLWRFGGRVGWRCMLVLDRRGCGGWRLPGFFGRSLTSRLPLFLDGACGRGQPEAGCDGRAGAAPPADTGRHTLRGASDAGDWSGAGARHGC